MKYNIAFSSSGVRFAAHVGVLAYFQDNNIPIANYSGTSGGAIVATWGANNLPARDLMNLTLQFGYAKYFTKPSFALGGMFDHSIFGKTIAAYCKPKENLWIATFNILKMKKKIWNGARFNLSKVLTATTCIPGLFKPVMYSNGLHVDGIFGSFCPDDIWDKGTTISVQLKCKQKTKIRYPFDDLVHKFEQKAIDFLHHNQKSENTERKVLCINPDVSSIAQLDIFAVKSHDHIELFQKGYEAAREAFSDQLSANELSTNELAAIAV